MTLAARYLNAGDTWIFMGACLAIAPLAVIIGDATEQIATYAGPKISGPPNATRERRLGEASQVLQEDAGAVSLNTSRYQWANFALPCDGRSDICPRRLKGAGDSRQRDRHGARCARSMWMR